MSLLTSAIQIRYFFPKNIDFFQVVTTFFVASLVLAVAIFLKYTFKRVSWSSRFPGKPVGLFNIFGNLADLYGRDEPNFNVAIFQLIGRFAKSFKHHKIFCVWISYAPFIILTKAEAIEALMSGTRTLKKGFSYTFLHPWLATGLLTSDGEKWKSRRKLLTPSFHFEILKDFLPIFNEQSQKLISVLKKETSKDYTDIVKPITLCSLDIICETTLGVSINAQDNKESEYVKAVCRQAVIVFERMFVPYYWVDAIYRFTKPGRQQKADLKLLHDFTRSIIRDKKHRLLSGDPTVSEKKKRKGLMDVLLEHHVKTKTLTEEDIREEVDTFAFEGHDTTSMGMSWALYLIGLHKDVQERLHEEMDRIFGDDTERPVTNDDLKDMEYLERVLKESQRLYPSVPFVSRETTEEINICGYTIPKRQECIAMIYFLHRDEEVFPDPEKFDPDRFLPENTAKRHPYAYIPFSAGARNCIGQRFAVMEEKVVVSHILRNYTIESLDTRDKVPLVPELILRPLVPIRIKIRPRKTVTL